MFWSGGVRHRGFGGVRRGEPPANNQATLTRRLNDSAVAGLVKPQGGASRGGERGREWRGQVTLTELFRTDPGT